MDPGPFDVRFHFQEHAIRSHLQRIRESLSNARIIQDKDAESMRQRHSLTRVEPSRTHRYPAWPTLTMMRQEQW